MKIIDIPRSGSAGSVTSSRNRAGQYVRNRRTPTQPIGSGRRAEIRSAFAAASSAWAGLTDAVRAAWTGFADSYPYMDSLGQAIKLTGHQLFVACATQLLNAGGAIPATAPATALTPSVSALDPICTAGGTPVFTVGITSTGLAADWLLVSVSPQVSPGVSFNGRWWQAIAVIGTEDTADILAAYTAEFGAPVVGRKIFVKVTPVAASGLTGKSFTSSVIVA